MSRSSFSAPGMSQICYVVEQIINDSDADHWRAVGKKSAED